ncbi:hypothetical protein BT69DRAFT_1280079 [Atractiella rhizophila]|nr:hypothetical protein BT69DRAFT_1280079 [Atractiella rhizophila]
MKSDKGLEVVRREFDGGQQDCLAELRPDEVWLWIPDEVDAGALGPLYRLGSEQGTSLALPWLGGLKTVMSLNGDRVTGAGPRKETFDAVGFRLYSLLGTAFTDRRIGIRIIVFRSPSSRPHL